MEQLAQTLKFFAMQKRMLRCRRRILPVGGNPGIFKKRHIFGVSKAKFYYFDT